MSAPLTLLLVAATFAEASPLRGIVLDPEGQPAAGAEVWFFAPDAFYGEPPRVATITGRDGRFTIPQPRLLIRRPYQVHARQRGVGTAAAHHYVGQLPLRMQLTPGTPLTVRVVDPDEAPVPGAQVTLTEYRVLRSRERRDYPHILPAHPRPLEVRATDAAGEAAFDCLPPGVEATLVIVTEKYGSQSATVATTAPHATVRLLPVGRLEGRLLCDVPSALAGARLRVNSHVLQPQPRFAGYVEATLDAEGRFVVPAIPAGIVMVAWIRADARLPFRTNSQTLYETRATVAPGETARLELPLTRGMRVFGKVIDADTEQPVAGAPVAIQAVIGNSQGLPTTVATDRHGRYEAFVPHGKAGERYGLIVNLAELPGALVVAEEDSHNPVVPLGQGEYEVRPFLVRQGVFVQGTVVSEQGRGVFEAQVAALSASEYLSERGTPGHAGRRLFAHTDEQGRFTLGPIAPDASLVLLAMDQTRASPEIVRLAPGADLGSIILPIGEQWAAPVAGRIVDEQDQPISDAHVFSYRHTEINQGPNPKYNPAEFLQLCELPPIWTDADGRFTLSHAVPRCVRYALSVPFEQGYEAHHATLDFSAEGTATAALAKIVLKARPKN